MATIKKSSKKSFCKKIDERKSLITFILMGTCFVFWFVPDIGSIALLKNFMISFAMMLIFAEIIIFAGVIPLANQKKPIHFLCILPVLLILGIVCLMTYRIFTPIVLDVSQGVDAVTLNDVTYRSRMSGTGKHQERIYYLVGRLPDGSTLSLEIPKDSYLHYTQYDIEVMDVTYYPNTGIIHEITLV